MTYCIMQSPRYLRVYLERSGDIAINELIFATQHLSGPAADIRMADIGGIPYILFEKDELLTSEDIQLLSRLSFAYAIFEMRSGLIAPVSRECNYFISEDISAILKYAGKTNEIFTRLMLNLAIAHCKDKTPRLLDPMAGKGTTLYEGLMQGLDVHGVEIDPKPVYESFVYIKKHLEMAKYKHTSHTEKTGGADESGKKFTATRYQVEMSRSKDEKRTGQTRNFEIIAGDTRHAGALFKKNFFNIIVADLPYGVHHGAKKKPKEAGLTRNALGLIKEAMPGWVKVLKPGGVIVLAWNLFLIPRAEMETLLGENGIVVPEEMAGLDFSHRLDQATHRDLIVGVYPR